jgi:hypothetical protein
MHLQLLLNLAFSPVTLVTSMSPVSYNVFSVSLALNYIAVMANAIILNYDSHNIIIEAGWRIHMKIKCQDRLTCLDHL